MSSLAPARSSFFSLLSLLRGSSSFFFIPRREETRALSLFLCEVSPLANANVKCAHPLTCLQPHLTDVPCSLSLSLFLSLWLRFLFFLLVHPFLSFELLPSLLFLTLLSFSFARSFLSYSETSSSVSSHNRCYSRSYRLTRHPLFRVQRTVHLAAI